MHLLKAVGSGIRTGWLILGMTLIAVLVIEAGSRLALTARVGLMDWLHAERWISDLRKRRPEAHAGAVENHGIASWFYELQREQRALQFAPRPYVRWQHLPHRSRYLNVGRNGVRATWNPPPQDGLDDPSAAVRIFTFGGSTMWGWIARDDYTIASHLSRLLHERGYRAQVTNYGEISYINTQEVIVLLRCIQRGEVPDIVLFYDGFNEAHVSYLGRGTGWDLPAADEWPESGGFSAPGWGADGLEFLSDNLWGGRRVIEGLQERVAAGWRRVFPPSSAYVGPRPVALDEERIRRVLRRYEANFTFVEALGRYYGFESLFYWQPTLYSKRQRSPYEEAINGSYFVLYEEVFDDLYRRVRQSEFLNGQPGFHDLSALFDDSEESYYLDSAHLSEAGNRLVAEAMVDDVIALIERRRAAVAARAVR